MFPLPCLDRIDVSTVEFTEPVKRIHDGADVQFFLHSLAYRDITTFILQLNRSVVPREGVSPDNLTEFRLDQSFESLPQIALISHVVEHLEALIEEAPPDTGPRRFGNVSFRKWYQLVEDSCQDLLEHTLTQVDHAAVSEIKAYLLGSFGSPQRLDYGTGHELSFIAFLACLWKVGFFHSAVPEDVSQKVAINSEIERQIVLRLFNPYLVLIRRLIVLYNLEPAGSHGVWGLDDNSFLPYLFGSAQLCPAISDDATDPPAPTPTSGSLPSSPDPSIVTKKNLVEKDSKSNLYFGAIQFIYTVKRGPFWEHSPILFDISGIKDGWGKINKGLIKMYDAEVLGKFPVVQHFPFGSLLKWEVDPHAKTTAQSTHTTNQPLRNPTAASNAAATMRPPSNATPGVGITTARSSAPPGFLNGVTQAPWAKQGNSTRVAPPVLSQASRPLGRPLANLREPTAVNPQQSRSGTATIQNSDKGNDGAS